MQTAELSISEVRAMYFDADALLISPVKLYRYHYKGDRYYYYQLPTPVDHVGLTTTLDDLADKPKIELAVGVTTLTRKTIPQDDQLIKWIAEMGYDAAMAYRDERAKYGSLLHTIAAELFIKRSFDLDLLEEAVFSYCAKNHIFVNQNSWVDNLKQDVLALAQFAIDYNVKPLAIELSLVSPRLGVAGTLDLLCEMDKEVTGDFGEVYASGERKGQPKLTKAIERRVAIVDFKSGRKSVGGKANAAQLAILKLLFSESVSGDNCSADFASGIELYNWHPKDWEAKPTYHLIDQKHKGWGTNEIEALVTQYRVHDPQPEDRTVLQMAGVVSLEAGATNANITLQNIKQLVQAAVDAQDVPLEQYDTIDNYVTYKLTDNGTEQPNSAE